MRLRIEVQSARGCPKRATLIAKKMAGAGRYVCQIELCTLHCDAVIGREQTRALEISNRRYE